MISQMSTTTDPSVGGQEGLCERANPRRGLQEGGGWEGRRLGTGTLASFSRVRLQGFFTGKNRGNRLGRTAGDTGRGGGLSVE